MDKDTTVLDDANNQMDDDYVFLEDDSIIIEEAAVTPHEPKPRSDKLKHLKKKILSPFSLLGKASLEKVFRRSAVTNDHDSNTDNIDIVEPAQQEVTTIEANEAIDATYAALTLASSIAVTDQLKTINTLRRKDKLHKYIKEPLKTFQTSLLQAAGVALYVEAIKKENTKRHELLLSAEARLDALKDEAAYWQHQYQEIERPEPLKAEIQYQKELLDMHAKTIALMTAMQNDLFMQHDAKDIDEWPLVSIIMPVWNRGELVSQAIDSVIAQTYPHWELIIIDDGSTDKTKSLIKHYLSDPRIQYHYQDHAGVSAARNNALELSTGQLIAYLDSDNTWQPHVLTMAAMAFTQDPKRQAIFFAADCTRENNTKWLYYPEQFNYDEVINANKPMEMTGIDINCYIHTRSLYEQLGGFDTSLTRLTDYELTYRHQKAVDIIRMPFIGTQYRYCVDSHAIAATENSWYNLHRIRNKHKLMQKNQNQLRVLYLTDAYPQLSESYLHNEIEYMRSQGIHVDVWTENRPSQPFAMNASIHTGSLIKTIQETEPDVIHAHMLTSLRHADIAAQFGIGMTVRGHGIDYSPELLQQLNDHPAIFAIYLFPHFHKKHADSLKTIKSMPVSFNPENYYPRKDKNKKLVLRVAAAVPENKLTLFIDIAKRCPEQRFILAVCSSQRHPEYLDELINYNKKQGTPVDFRINVTPDVISHLVKEAGIYLHTHALKGEHGWVPYGMPVSICEAMATGSYILSRDCIPAKKYLGHVGDYYTTVDEAAALIKATASWSDEKWHLVQERAINRAYQYFVNDNVLSVLNNDWEAIQFIAKLPHHSDENTLLH